MVNAIFCAHGKLACAMLESVQMVYGDARVEAVEFIARRERRRHCGKAGEVSKHSQSR